MVAPHQVGNLVRSFVRVPGSGSEKSTKSAFCDLARASTLAARVSILQNLPPATNVLTQTPSATQAPSNQLRKRPRPDGKENVLLSSSPVKVTRIEASPIYIPIKTIPVTLMAAVRIPSAEVHKLKEENEQLRKENETLKKQLSLFKQLFQNPQRLNSVLCRLKEKTKGGL